MGGRPSSEEFDEAQHRGFRIVPMPSPFPGMDPYLENPATWPDLHLALIAGIKRRLTADLRPKYYARAEERVYLSDEDDPGRAEIVPDVRVIHRPEDDSTWNVDSAGVAVAEPIVCTTLIEDEIRERFVEVIDAATRIVVTIIEVLSPANKTAGSRGLTNFRTRRHEVMRSETHRVEIDLLRKGERLVAAEALPRGDYLFHVSRVGTQPSGTVWPIRLSERLPLLPIPLRPGDDDYALDMQRILTEAYDESAYDLEIDYDQEPTLQLSAEQSAWADRWLRAKGVRTA